GVARDRIDLDRVRSARGSRRRAGGARRVLVRPELRLPALAAHLRCGRAGWNRERLRRAARRPRPRSRNGVVDVVGLRRGRQSDVQTSRGIRRSDARVAGTPAGAVRKGDTRVSTLASGGFWAFVFVVAGIYTIFALGLQLQFGFAGLLNFGQVAFMAIGAYTMAIFVVKEGWSTWLAAPLGVVAAGAAGLLLGLPALRLRSDYFAIVTIAFSEIVRYVATNENSLTGGSQGTIALGKVGTAAQYNGQWERFQARVQSWLGVSSK